MKIVAYQKPAFYKGTSNFTQKNILREIYLSQNSVFFHKEYAKMRNLRAGE